MIIPKGNDWISSFGLTASCQKVPKFEFRFSFSLKNTNLGAHFLLLKCFDKINLKKNVLLKWCPILNSSSSKTQNSIISFGYVDSYAKIFLILYPPLGNSTTGIAIPRILAKLGTFSPKVTVNKLKFRCNKKIPSATLHPIALNLESLLSERLQYTKFFHQSKFWVRILNKKSKIPLT